MRTVLKLPMNRPVCIQVRKIVETMLSSIKLEKISSPERRPRQLLIRQVFCSDKSSSHYSVESFGDIREKVTQKCVTQSVGARPLPVKGLSPEFKPRE